MIVTIIIITYILNVFLNRGLNKTLCSINSDYKVIVKPWFYGLAGTLALTLLIFKEKDLKFTDIKYLDIKNWFILK